MNPSTALRHLREGFLSVFRNGWMSFASISSIFISLLILGAFLLFTLNVNNFADEIESQVEIKIFLNLDTTKETIDELKGKIADLKDVKKVKFVSKEEGLEILRTSMGDDSADLLDGYDGKNNPLPDGFIIEVDQPQQIAHTVKEIEAIGASMEKDPFYSLKYGQGTVEKLFELTNAARNVGLFIVAGLAVTAIFLISTTIKTTIEARQREIGIMKLVGATNQFIRWPFFVEGALIGLMGSILTTGLLLVIYARLITTFKLELGLLIIKLIPLSDVAPTLSLLIIGLGTVIGIWGSTLSIRKHLKV